MIFIVIGVDENINSASGCSIDSLFKQISDIEVGYLFHC